MRRVEATGPKALASRQHTRQLSELAAIDN